MKKLLIVTMLFAGVSGGALGQTPYRVFTSPKMPARDALERMNLVVAWHARLKVAGQRDGLYSVQVIPGESGAQVVVQTYEGVVHLLDAEHGELLWKAQIGVPYWPSRPVGHNADNIFATRRQLLYVVNRFNGTQRVFKVNSATNVVSYGYEMEFVPSAAPVADEDTLYVSMGDRLNAITIPPFVAMERAQRARAKLAKLPGKEEKTEERDPTLPPPPGSLDSPQPDFYWGYRLANEATEASPLVFGEQLSILTTAGNLIFLNRFGAAARLGSELEFKTTGRVSAEAGQNGPIAYIASDDFNLYAINIKGGGLLWRYVGGAPILQKPEVNDDYVFVTPKRLGMRCVDRLSGRELWVNRDVSRFLAANKRFVYALDHVGKFFVLDAWRGTTLAWYDLSEWGIPIANDMTDRIYLAANDGQIICLRNRDQVKPLLMKRQYGAKLEERKPAEGMKKIEQKKDDDKKDEDKKEAEKKDENANAALRLDEHAIPPRMSRLALRTEALVRTIASKDRRDGAGR